MLRPSIEVRKATLYDESAVKLFYQQAYGERGTYKYPERWRWLYVDNPFIPEGMAPTVWIAVHQGRVVGHSGAMYVPLQIGEKTFPSSWGVDLAVLDEFQGRGIAKQLLSANLKAQMVSISISASPVTRAIRRKLGGIEGPSVNFYSYTTKLATKFLFERLKSRVSLLERNRQNPHIFTAIERTKLTSFAAYLIQLYLHYLQCRDQPLREHAVTFRAVTGRFQSEADELFQQIKQHYHLAVERTSRYLNWKFVDQPFAKFQRYYIVHKEQIIGLLIYRLARDPEPPIGIICELYTVDNSIQTLAQIIRSARSMLLAQGAIGVYCASALPAQQTALDMAGFLRISSKRVLISFQDSALNGQSLPVCETSPTLFGRGDHDLDEFPWGQQITLSQVLDVLRNPR